MTTMGNKRSQDAKTCSAANGFPGKEAFKVRAITPPTPAEGGEEVVEGEVVDKELPSKVAF